MLLVGDQLALGQRQRIEIFNQRGHVGACHALLVTQPDPLHDLPDGRILNALQIGDQRSVRLADRHGLNAGQTQAGRGRYSRKAAPRDDWQKLVLVQELERTAGGIDAH